MASRPQPSLADYVAVALGPALIMAMVGSLVFFLLEVFYAGQYEGRMQWILFCFVFCAVLIARISMTAGISERAPLYGIGLGLVVWFALGKFVEFPNETLAAFSWVINLGLIGLIWWSAYKLTWDCTYIDENVDASGAGLLEKAGLEKKSAPEPDDAEEPESPKDADETLGWWARYQQYREQQRTRPHAPGVWIVYFALAALPLFGLGQSLIEKQADRHYAFWLMVIYVGSALGLLLTTSFLGLRRYLRQRQLRMPLAMTGMWLGLGGTLIVVLLVVGALLPRPYAEYSVLTLAKLGSKDRDASKWSPSGNEPGKGEGRAGSQGAKEGQGNSSRKGQESGGKGQGEGKSGSGDKNSDGSKAGDRAGSGQDQQSKDTNTRQRDSNAKSDRDSKSGDQKADADAKDGSSSSFEGVPQISTAFSGLTKFLKIIVFIVVGVIVAFIVIRALLRLMANFSGWAKGLLAALDRFWKGLFGWLQPSASVSESEHVAETRELPRPFSAFANPFHTGMSGSPEELVRYSFEALEAWAWEQGLGRQGDDTPLEFADRISLDHPKLGADARKLAALYARAAYGRGRLPPKALDTLRHFWERLESTHAASGAVS